MEGTHERVELGVGVPRTRVVGGGTTLRLDWSLASYKQANPTAAEGEVGFKACKSACIPSLRPLTKQPTFL